jgi:hypothetical protein
MEREMAGPSVVDSSKRIRLIEKADLLHEIVEHTRRVDSEKEEYENPDSSLINVRLTENEELRARSTAPQGQERLSHAFVVFAESTVTRAEKISVTRQEFTVDVIIRRLKALNQRSDLGANSCANDCNVGESNLDASSSENFVLDWKQIGKKLLKFYRIPPSIAFVRGPIGAPPKGPRTRVRSEGSAREEKRIRQTENGPVQRPMLVDPNEGLGQIETDKRVDSMCKYIRERGEMSFFQLVVDKDSYAKTIENIFYFSFLIKDGLASISERNGVPWVGYMDPKGSHSTQRDKESTSSAPFRTDTSSPTSQLSFEDNQLILSLDYETWEAWKKQLY